MPAPPPPDRCPGQRPPAAQWTLEGLMFRAIADVISGPCMLIGPGWEIREANMAAWQELALPRTAVVGRSVPDFSTDAPDVVRPYLVKASRGTVAIPGILSLPHGEDGARTYRCRTGRLAGGAPFLLLHFGLRHRLVSRFLALTAEARERRRGSYLAGIERARLAARAEEAEEAVMTDPPTGLGSRLAQDAELGRLEAAWTRDPERENYVITVLDVDGLKAVNDSRGHAEGDRLLRTVGRLIKDTIRGSDAAFRVGGDEFTILARTAPDAYRNRFPSIAAGIDTALAAAGFPEAGVSWGIAARSDFPSQAETAAEADRTMYARKRLRKGGRESFCGPPESACHEPSPVPVSGSPQVSEGRPYPAASPVPAPAGPSRAVRNPSIDG